jgi:hypothetical protein
MNKSQNAERNSFNGTWNDAKCFEHEMKLSINMDNEGYVSMFENTAKKIREITNAKSFTDCGGGMGVYAYANRDILNKYYDLSPLHCEYASKYIPKEKIIQGDFTTLKIDEKELVSSIEVMEHIEDEKLIPFLKNLECKYFHFSSTPHKTDFDIEWGHINIKQENEWIKLFEDCGFKYHSNVDLPTSWSLLFSK